MKRPLGLSKTYPSMKASGLERIRDKKTANCLDSNGQIKIDVYVSMWVIQGIKFLKETGMKK